LTVGLFTKYREKYGIRIWEHFGGAITLVKKQGRGNAYLRTYIPYEVLTARMEAGLSLGI